MVQSLIQRIRENKLDALYLFINESLRDRNEFDTFFQNLLVVLPNNWSINRVEIGHEFLSRTVFADQQAAPVEGNDHNENGDESLNDGDNSSNESKQDQLFRWVCSLESLRSLIISDGYIPRKDHGFVDTRALLRNLPRANNLQYLDVQRLKLRIAGDGIENNDAELMAESLDSVRDSLEDLRLTAISMWDTASQETNNAVEEQQSFRFNASQNYLEQQQRLRYPLDATIRVCGEMANLQLLAISCANCCECHSENGEDQQQIESAGDRDGGHETDSNGSQSSNKRLVSSKNCLISREVLLHLCRSSSTLQELALRSMRINDDMCKTIARAFDPPGNNKRTRTYLPPSSSSLSLLCSDSEQDNEDEFEGDAIDMNDNSNAHSPSFWTSLDLRRNHSIGNVGYEAILSSLERNYDLWCSLMVDNDSFQSRFNALIELNQANRGALVRSPTPEKLAVFLDRLKDDPTALWYFLTIHRDSILHPLIRYLKWKNSISRKPGENRPCARQQQHLFQHSERNQSSQKRGATSALIPPAFFQPIVPNSAITGIRNGTSVDTKFMDRNNEDEAKGQSQQPSVKRLRQSTEDQELSS